MRIYCQELQGDVIVKQLIGICKGSIPDTYIRIIKDRYLTMKYKAIALDLDGTLTDHNKKLPEANKEAVWAAIDKDVTVILASGRPLFGITPIADELELDKRGGYILAYNGGDGGGIGARASDAVFLQRLDEGGFGVPGRRLGEMLVAAQDLPCQFHADPVGFLWHDLPRFKGLDQVTAQVCALVDGMAACPFKFNVGGLGGAAEGGHQQLPVRLVRIADIVNRSFQR